MEETQKASPARTGKKNLKPSHFTCDHCNSLIWVEEEETFPECENCGETTYTSKPSGNPQ